MSIKQTGNLFYSRPHVQQLAPFPTYSRHTKDKWWTNEWLFLRRQSLYSKPLCTHCKTLDVLVFYFRIFLYCFSEVHWVVQGAVYLRPENETLTMKSPLNPSNLGVYFAHYSVHCFLSDPGTQNSLVIVAYCFPYSTWQNSFGSLPLPSPFLTITSAEKQKPSNSFSTDKWATSPSLVSQR